MNKEKLGEGRGGRGCRGGKVWEGKLEFNLTSWMVPKAEIDAVNCML